MFKRGSTNSGRDFETRAANRESPEADLHKTHQRSPTNTYDQHGHRVHFTIDWLLHPGQQPTGSLELHHEVGHGRQTTTVMTSKEPAPAEKPVQIYFSSTATASRSMMHRE